MLKVKIVSDVSCPWCIIGYSSLAKAIGESGLEAEIELQWKPFELNPNMPAEGQDRAEHIQQKYGLTKEQGNANRQNIINRGSELGYEFSFPESGRVYNTFKAHRLIHWAADFSLQTELKLALFDLYFKQGGNPSDEDSLLKCVELVGLDVQLARDILNSDLYSEQVRQDQQWNSQNGISAVPAFIFNDKYLVSGGQPPEVFMNVFNELKKNETSEAR